MRRTDFERSVNRPGVPVTPDYERHKSRRKMKCLVSVGLVLPALAAVIGVVAWAVSADIVMGHRNGVDSPDLRLQDEMGNDAVLQERSDVMYEGRSDGLQMIDNSDTAVSSTIRSEKKEDPPYFVHVVVPDKPSTDSPGQSSTQSAVTDVNAFLSKIISASKGSNKILVVPFPGPLPAAINEEDKSSRFDDDEEDNEPTVRSASVPPPRNSNLQNATGRPLGPQRSGEQPYGDNIRTYHLKNEGEIRHYMQQNGGGLRIQSPPQQPQLPPHQQHHNPPRHNQPQKPQNPPKSYYQQQPAPQQQHPPPPPPPPPPSMQQYRPPPHSRPHHPPPNFEQGTGNRAYVPKPAQHQPVPYYEAPNDGQRNKPDRESQGYDSNRWGSVDGEGYGHEAPKGITVTFGSGPGQGYGGGGGYHHHGGHHVEPLSVIKSLFLPFLPKPRVNLNGRVVFGVVLEKGVGLGGNKGAGGSGVSLGGYH